MSHPANDQHNDSLMDLDYHQLTDLYLKAEIDLVIYEELLENLRASCPHDKTHIVTYHVGGRDPKQYHVCQTCFHAWPVDLNP